jgi:chromosome partitioning protein
VGGIIVIGGSKGGNGKTLLTALLAPGLAQRGYRTGVIDADPNAVFSAWHAEILGPAPRG